jgi:hypothetical protein
MGIYGRPVLGQAVAAALEPKLTHSIHAYFLQHHECLRSPPHPRTHSIVTVCVRLATAEATNSHEGRRQPASQTSVGRLCWATVGFVRGLRWGCWSC